MKQWSGLPKFTQLESDEKRIQTQSLNAQSDAFNYTFPLLKGLKFCHVKRHGNRQNIVKFDCSWLQSVYKRLFQSIWGKSENVLTYTKGGLGMCVESKGVQGKQGTMLNKKETCRSITMWVLAWTSCFQIIWSISKVLILLDGLKNQEVCVQLKVLAASTFFH